MSNQEPVSIYTLSAVECEKLREERYNAQHPANAVFDEEYLVWRVPGETTAPATTQVETPAETPAEVPQVETPTQDE